MTADDREKRVRERAPALDEAERSRAGQDREHGKVAETEEDLVRPAATVKSPAPLPREGATGSQAEEAVEATDEVLPAGQED